MSGWRRYVSENGMQVITRYREHRAGYRFTPHVRDPRELAGLNARLHLTHGNLCGSKEKRRLIARCSLLSTSGDTVADGERGGDGQGKPRLADAARTCDRDQSVCRIAHHADEGSQLRLTTDERCQRDRDSVGWRFDRHTGPRGMGLNDIGLSRSYDGGQRRTPTRHASGVLLTSERQRGPNVSARPSKSSP